MNCLDISDKLFEFYDNELPEQEKNEVSTHLNSCKKCSFELEKLKQTSLVLIRTFEEPVSPQFSIKVMETIFGEKTVMTGWLGLPRWEVAFVLSLGFLMISYFLAHSSQTLRLPPQKDWFFSSEEVKKEDALQIVLGAERSNEHAWEGLIDE